MASRDLINNLKEGAGLAPAVRTATALGSAFDVRGYKSVIARVHLGTFGDTQSGSIYIEAELQESDDNSTYTAVADADLLFLASSARAAFTGTAVGTFVQTKTTAGADVAGLYAVGYRGSKRYLKVNMRLTGTHTNGTPSAVSFTASNPDYAPV